MHDYRPAWLCTLLQRLLPHRSLMMLPVVQRHETMKACQYIKLPH
jgi:hypothetical protein